MNIKSYYIKNLKMSPEKLAAQIGHVTKELGRKVPDSDFSSDRIVVLGVSQTKFNSLLEDVKQSGKPFHVQVDGGFTEVPAGTITSFGYVE